MYDRLTFFHFNDVYHVSDINLISRFAHICRSVKASATPALTVFSGDAFSPSLESAVLKGDHMVPVLNHLGIDVACYGNHDFDFGEARLTELSQKTTFPWLLSNVVRPWPKNKELLAGAKEFIVKSMGDYRIGFFGLGGTDWPSNCQNLPPSHVQPPMLVSQRLTKYLRTVKKCDFVIGITHMRLHQDLAVSKFALRGEERVDLILGGHDHQVVCRLDGDIDANPNVTLEGRHQKDIVSQGQAMNVDGNVRIVKSGTDWRSYSIVNLFVSRDRNGRAHIETVRLSQCMDLMSHKHYSQLPADPRLREIVSEIQSRITNEVQHPLLSSLVPLDGRSSSIRSRETNLGNLLADAVRAFYNADIALVNSGGVRCDRIMQDAPNAGCMMSVKDMIDVVPFDTAFVVKLVQGKALLAALENSISDAHTDGRFLQVSGLRFIADWQNPEGHRLLQVFHVPRFGTQEQQILDRFSYGVAMSSFIASGFDGYDCLKNAKTVKEDQDAVTDTSLMLNIFRHPMLEHDSSSKNTALVRGIKQARDAVVVGHDIVHGVPQIYPVVDGRITFIDSK